MKLIQNATCAMIACCLALTLVAAQEKPEEPDPGEKAREKIAKLEDSTSLRWNAEAIAALAIQEGDDVVPTLLDLYRNPPEDYPVNMRYLVATHLRARYLGNDYPELHPSEPDIKQLRKFLESSRKIRERAWAVYCVAGILAQLDDPEINLELYEIIGDDDYPAANRVSVLEALSESGPTVMRRLLEIMLNGDYEDDAEDCVMLEAAVWATARVYKPLFKPGEPIEGAWRKLFETVVAYLEDEELESRTRREIALALQHCFGTKHAYPWAMMWQGLFRTGEDPKSDTGRTVAKFMGMEIEGDRIVFLIDASDSMLNPLNEEEKEAVRTPTTGDAGDESYEINWDRVKNRFDAAREHLKWTLSRLPDNTEVAVILFGSDVEVLSATPSFVRLKRKSRKRIFWALDGIQPGKPVEARADIRPHGVLRGETNYYQALLSAYRMGRGGVIEQPVEHCDVRLALDGADSIVLLSDGVPNRDGFSGAGPVGSRINRQHYKTKQPGEGYWVDVPASPPSPPREIEERDPETGEIVKRQVPG